MRNWRKNLLLIAVLVTAAVSIAPLSVNLISWWPLDGDLHWTDAYGTNDGTSIIGTTQVASGSGLGDAYNFDGSGDSVSIAQSGFSLDILTNISLAWWMRANSLTGGNDYIFVKTDYVFTKEGNGLRLALPGVTSSPFNAAAIIEDTVGFHHYAVTRNQSTGDVIFYLDGAEHTSLSGGTELLGTAGSSVSIGNFGLDVALDDIRLWEKVLTPDEVSNLFEGSTSGVSSTAEVTTFFETAFSTLGMEKGQGAGFILLLTMIGLIVGTRNLWISLTFGGIMLIGFVVAGFIPVWIMAFPTLIAAYVIVSRFKGIME